MEREIGPPLIETCFKQKVNKIAVCFGLKLRVVIVKVVLSIEVSSL